MKLIAVRRKGEDGLPGSKVKFFSANALVSLTATTVDEGPVDLRFVGEAEVYRVAESVNSMCRWLEADILGGIEVEVVVPPPPVLL